MLNGSAELFQGCLTSWLQRAAIKLLALLGWCSSYTAPLVGLCLKSQSSPKKLLLSHINSNHGSTPTSPDCSHPKNWSPLGSAQKKKMIPLYFAWYCWPRFSTSGVANIQHSHKINEHKQACAHTLLNEEQKATCKDVTSEQGNVWCLLLMILSLTPAMCKWYEMTMIHF